MKTERTLIIVVLIATLFLAPLAGQSSPGTSEGEVVTVTDALGRSVSFPSSPERVTAAGRAVLMIADAVYLFPNGRERLTAVGRIDQGKGNFLPQIDSDYNEKQILQRNAGAEQVAATRPDVVILKDFMKGSLGDPIERLGIPVVYVRLETPEDYRRDIRILGRVFNQQRRAEEIVSYIDERLSYVRSRVDSVPAGERPDSLFAYYALQGNEAAVNVPPRGWIQTSLLSTAGAKPVWASAVSGGGWQTVSIEQILSWTPEEIFVVSYRNDIEDVIMRIRRDRRWAALQAVENDRIHAFPLDYYSWDQPDVRWVLGLQWLAKTLHPERFSDLNMSEAVYEFFGFMYGLSRSEIRRVILPVLEGDIEIAE